MKVNFGMVSDPVVRAKLETLDFAPEVAEQFALELLALIGADTDLGSFWTTFQYDEGDGNRVVGYDISRLPARASKLGRA
jgi:hypothetical protein